MEEESYFQDMQDLKDFIVSDNDEESEEIDFDNIDFSDASGGFKKSLKRGTRKSVSRKKKRGGIKSKILIPNDRRVTIQGMDKMLLGKGSDAESIRNIGYYKGKRLKVMVFTINNEGALDFDIELFNPSMPLDYLQSTGQNLNDKIQVAGAGSNVLYTDILYGMLANPILIPNMRVVISGASATSQRPQPIIVLNKSIEGSTILKPANVGLFIDSMQVDANIVQFDIMNSLNRAYVPDGMDIMKYKVLAGNTVTFAFYYKQHQIKRFFFPETRTNKIL